MKTNLQTNTFLRNIFLMKRFYSILGLSLLLFTGAQAQNFPFEVEAYQVHSATEGLIDLDGMTTYRLYMSNMGPTDFISSVFGNDTDPFEISAPGGVFNTGVNASWSASGISGVFIGFFPEMEWDSFATIGLSESAASSGIAGAADPSIVEDPSQQITPMFLNNGSTGASINSVTGMAYYILNGNTAGLPDATGRVLIMQITTSGTLSGTVNVQIFPNGIGTNFVTATYLFDGVGLYAAVGACLNDTDGDGICDEDEIPGCTDMTACNYDMTATDDDGSCDFVDTDGDGICDVSEIPGCTDMAACNYDPAATDDDGSCGVLDACGVCLGDDSSCTGCGIEFACNYDATAVVIDNTLCEYESCEGCMDMTACNYDATATFDPGTICIYAVEFLDCAGNCLNDSDADGVCDELEIVGCTDMTACNYDDTATDTDDTLCVYAVVNYDCDGNCINDTDGDGVCDENEISGCTDMTACNYDDTATEEDDTCDFSCYGCTDAAATNYDMDATMDDASCCYLVIDVAVTNAVCYDGEGMINATVTGATETVTYTLGEMSNETGEFVVAAGTYTVTATDSNANLCSSSMEVTVMSGVEMTITASATDETAAEAGVGTATATGGDGVYTFVWTNADGNEVGADALTAGEYTVTVTDGLGCTASTTVTVILNGIEIVEPLAFGMFPNPSTGSVTIQVASVVEDVRMQVLDATGRLVYTQEAVVLQGATIFNFSGIATGTYTIMLSNDLGTSVRRLSIQH
ncbi:MAG TPA: T9SS type A sorting domain-containing protein [Flavobacteriales bacterium]|nr:T9SS type A sorting domain-containing protein [Flavobacteriales bacterium]